MIWESVYRAALLSIGEKADCPLFCETAVLALDLAAKRMSALYSAYMHVRGEEEKPILTVTSLLEECPFPAPFFEALVYSLCASLLQNEDTEAAKAWRAREKEALATLESSLPACIHAIEDCYG
jgi:hypothetical protein